MAELAAVVGCLSPGMVLGLGLLHGATSVLAGLVGSVGAAGGWVELLWGQEQSHTVLWKAPRAVGGSLGKARGGPWQGHPLAAHV